MNEKKILMLLGGNYHDFDGFAQTISPILAQSGYQVEPTYEPDALLQLDSAQVDIVLMYTCLSGSVQNGNKIEDLNPDQTAALAQWVRRGGGLLAVHAATVMGEANTELRRLLGGRFISHPPQFAFTVYPMQRRHPISEGIDAFTVFDEFYMQNYDDTVEIHLAAFDRGVCYPMAWSRAEEKGRVAHIALGHGPRTWQLPPYQQLILQAVNWLACWPEGLLQFWGRFNLPGRLPGFQPPNLLYSE